MNPDETQIISEMKTFPGFLGDRIVEGRRRKQMGNHQISKGFLQNYLHGDPRRTIRSSLLRQAHP